MHPRSVLVVPRQRLSLHVLKLGLARPVVHDVPADTIRPPRGDRARVVARALLATEVVGVGHAPPRHSRRQRLRIGIRTRAPFRVPHAPSALHPFFLEHATARWRGMLLVQRAPCVRADLALIDARDVAVRRQRLSRHAPELVANVCNVRQREHRPVRRTNRVEDAPAHVIVVPPRAWENNRASLCESRHERVLPPRPRGFADRLGLGLLAVFDQVVRHEEVARQHPAGHSRAAPHRHEATALLGVPPARRLGIRTQARGKRVLRVLYEVSHCAPVVHGQRVAIRREDHAISRTPSQPPRGKQPGAVHRLAAARRHMDHQAADVPALDCFQVLDQHPYVRWLLIRLGAHPQRVVRERLLRQLALQHLDQRRTVAGERHPLRSLRRESR